MNLESPYNHEIAVIEACLLTATAPITAEQLIKVFEDNLSQTVIEDLILQLQQKYLTSSIELIKTATGYRFRSKVEYQRYINKLYAVKPPKYSRSIMETLAIIAYKQPITRGEIEEIRGVQVNSNIIQILNERGWIEIVGHKQVPGKPELLGTTNILLEDLGITSLHDLPPLTNPEDTLNKPIPHNYNKAN
ncbi:MAG: SMC-Scp complex subunit ScpB [Burkholderiales bacterium]|nr:SMC-Scp complex subunit ScpB [Burkholderiales bacterium]